MDWPAGKVARTGSRHTFAVLALDATGNQAAGPTGSATTGGASDTTAEVRLRSMP